VAGDLDDEHRVATVSSQLLDTSTGNKGSPTSAKRWTAPQRYVRRRGRFDVVFYTPWIGSIVSRAGRTPPGGAETQILMLAKGLAERGVRVAVIAFGRPDELPTEVDGVTVLARAPYRRRMPLVGKLAETAIIWRALWRAPSEAIVYRGVGLELLLLALYARIGRRRLVFSSANVVDFECRKLLAKHRDAVMYELGVRLADTIVVQTEEQVEMCREKFGRRPVLIKSITPLAQRQTAVPEAFLWVGRLVSYKGPLEYVALARAIPEARFWMIGVPPPREDEQWLAEQVATEASALPNLDLLSPRPRSEIEELMSRAVASVNTAEFEGMPNVLLEAWTRGVPALVLAHDPGGVVSAHQIGAFADGSQDRLVALARELWAERADTAHRERLGRRCQAYITATHAPDAVVDQWTEVLPGPAAIATYPGALAVEPRCAG
jgi:glycosyltransferase involved in cell wall biosynthesis